MQLSTDLPYQYALDRQQRLRAEAAAHRLARPTPIHTRFNRLLCRIATRYDLNLACNRSGTALPERG